MSKKRWRKPMQLTLNGGRGSAWAYVSKSGKTVEIYIESLDNNSIKSAKISIPRVKRWVSK